jgi:hypothetical protein
MGARPCYIAYNLGTHGCGHLAEDGRAGARLCSLLRRNLAGLLCTSQARRSTERPDILRAFVQFTSLDLVDAVRDARALQASFADDQAGSLARRFDDRGCT